MVVMQAIMAGIILDRHWEKVTQVLGRSLSREIGFLTDLYDHSPKTPEDIANIERIADKRLDLKLHIERNSALPKPVTPPLFSLVDAKLTKYLTRDTERPFWIDSAGQSGYVDIRVEVEPGTIFRILIEEERAYASSTNALLSWMVVSSMVLILIAIIFMRKQIQPILDLALAARRFGMGHDVEDFNPRGATEVREAAQAFINMKDRIEKHVEQRTAMLAGVSHDLRTILTRFKLELAFLRRIESPGAQAGCRGNAADARGLYGLRQRRWRRKGGGVRDISASLTALRRQRARGSVKARIQTPDGLVAKVKPNAFRRLATNLISNAARFGKTVAVAARTDGHSLIFTVDDDGPGIPAAMREDVFRPFVRLDVARNQDETGTGLGLSIARDIARAHGGDITLEDSPLGGLRAIVAIPV